MTLPNAPQGLAATVAGATVALSWTANPQSDGVVEYLIFRTPTVYFMPELIAATAGTAYTDSSGEVLPNTHWYYFVIAVNAAGTSPAAATTSVTIPLPLPSAPTGLVATANGNDTVSLSWNANPVGQDVTSYNVYREASGSSSATLVATVAGTSYTDASSALTAGASWTYYLTAVNAAGTSPAAAPVSVTIPLPLPSAPTGLVATASGNDTVSLSWSANPASQDVTGYNVYREASGSSSATLLTTVAGTSYTDTGNALTAGSSWAYYLKAVNATGTSPASAPASVTIPQSKGGGTLIATVAVNNYGTAPVANPQMSLAQPFAPGDVPSGNFIQLRKSDGVTVIPSQQDQESTWLQDNSWKTVAISSVSPDTFAAGETITYQLWSVPGSPNRTPNVTLAQLVANSDIKLLFTGYDLGADTWEVSVNDIVANGTNWPWGQNPMRGWEVIRSGPLCTEWRFWSVLRRVSDGAWHPWIRCVLFVRAWGAAGPYEIGGYWCMPNIFGPNPGSASGGGTISTSNANDFIFAICRMTSTQSPTAGSSWNQLCGQNYLLVESQNVSSVQTGLVPPISTGNNNQQQGIGDAIAGGTLDTNANAIAVGGNSGGTSSIALPGLSTSGTNRVIVVAVEANSYPVTSITSTSGLTFSRRTQVSGSSSGVNIYLEEWWAAAPTPLTNEIITVNIGGNAQYALEACAFAVSGANTAAPFDSNPALPASLVGPGAGPEAHYCFTATLQDGNAILQYYGGPNDYRTAATSGANAVPLSSSTVSGNQINLTEAQHVALCGASSYVCNSPANSNFSANAAGSAALPVVLSVSGGSLPGGLTAGQVYWMGSNPNNFSVYFCTSLTNASGGSGGAISLSSTGSGNLTITPVSQCYPVMAQAVLGRDCRRVWRNGVAPTLLVEHDFTYLTTKARVIPPFIPGITVDAGAAPSVTPQFSQCALYFPGSLGATGDQFNDDRIGWLTHHQACELYRPFDNSLHQLNLAIAASWIEYGYWALNETLATYPVVNVTNYPNMGTPVGPNSRWVGFESGAITVQVAEPYLGDIDGSHQPCPMILPYLKTGDFLWYEAMAMFSSTRMLSGYYNEVTVGSVTAYKPWSYIAGPASTPNSQGGAGFYYDSNNPDDAQIRGIGWLMRYFGTTVHFMPANRPEAQYFRDQLHGYIAIMDENTILNYTSSALGFLEAGNESSNPLLPYSHWPFMHDYCYLCWAMEAWKGEYAEAVHFITNFFYKYCPKRTDTSNPNNPGTIWGIDIYHHCNADQNGNWYQTWDAALAATAQYTSEADGCDAMVSFTEGSNQLTIVHTTNLYNVEAGETLVNTTFGDFSGYPLVQNVSGTTVTLEALYGAGSPPAASVTRSIITATTTGGSGTTLNFRSVPSGVVVGMGVFDVSNPGVIPIGTMGTGNWPRSTFVTAVGPTSVTLDTPIGAQGGPTSIPSGDLIAFGAIARFNTMAQPWPGVAKVNSTFPFTDTICPISNAAEYTAPFSYACTYTCALALADVLYQQTGNANLASARAAYNEIRRRQYLTVLSDGKTPSPFGALSFTNAPKYAIGPIGATQ